jgi:hypothetical protein
MAFAFIAASNVSSAGKGASSSTSLFYSLTLAAGTISIVLAGKDNIQTTDGQTSEVTSVSDNKGNTFTKIGEFTNGQTAADAGATISVWKCKLTTGVISTDSVSINYSGTPTARPSAMRAYSITSGNDVQMAGTLQTAAVDGAVAGSMSVSGLTSKEYLFIRATALESATTTFTPTTNFTTFINIATSGGAAATNMALFGEYRILTGTSATSAPTTPSGDSASVMFALEEFSSTAVRRHSTRYGYFHT